MADEEDENPIELSDKINPMKVEISESVEDSFLKLLDRNFRSSRDFSSFIFQKFWMIENNNSISLWKNLKTNKFYLFGQYYNDWFTPGVGDSYQQVKLTLKFSHPCVEKFFKVYIRECKNHQNFKYI